MGIRDALSKLAGSTLSGRKEPRLVKATGDAPVFDLDRLEVSTAEAIVILTVTPHDVPCVKAIAEDNEPAILLGPDGTRVHVQPTLRDDLPVKDPDRGWIVPLTPAARTAIAAQLEAAPEGYQLTDGLAIVVE